MTWWAAAAEHVARGDALALVTICTVKGSAPREPGAKMLVWANSQHGTIGGGQLEFALVEQARKLLATNAPWRFQNYPLGPLLGQCCGGNVGILLERVNRASNPWLERIAAMEASGQEYSIVSTLATDAVDRTVIAGKGNDGVTMRFPAAAVTQRLGEGAVITEQVTPRPQLLLFGAGHVGQALGPIAATLPFQLRWFDTRPEFAQGSVSFTDDPAGVVGAAAPGSYFLIFTHSHALDYDLTRAVMARGDFAYCGLIGSTTKRVRFERRLLSDNIVTASLARLTCPIGAIGVNSKLPQAMAVAIAAELLLVQEATVKSATRPLRIVHAT